MAHTANAKQPIARLLKRSKISKTTALVLTAFVVVLGVVVIWQTRAASATVKIMPLGDSITQAGGTTMGYKGYLLDKLIAAGKSIDYVGSQRATGPSQLKDWDHEGHSGWQNNALAANSEAWVRTYAPDVVMLHSGTNDIWSGIDANTAASRLKDLINAVYRGKSDTRLIVAIIVPMNVGKDAQYNSYVAQIPGIVSSFKAAGKNIDMVDMRTKVTTAYMGDGIHPNDAGTQLMAEVWYPNVLAAVNAVIGFSATPSPTAKPTSGLTGDLNKDGAVNITDLSQLLSNWGKSGTGDINGDGTVGVTDLSILLSNWGKTANPTPTPTATPTATPTSAPTATPVTGGGSGTWWSGQSDTSTTKDGSFAAWRGRSVEIGGTWASSQNSGDAIESPMWSVSAGNPYANVPRMDYAIGAMIDNSGESWSAAASGAYDSRWAQQLQRLKTGWGNRPAGNMYIRFAHEFNGNWYPWSVKPADVASFKTAWARFANLRNQYFPGAQIVWCPNAGSSWPYDIRTLYPGNQYVDVIGIDKYNNYPWVNDQAGFNTEIARTSNGGPLGLETYRQFALQQGKPFAVPEWSNDGNPAGEGNQGGGDSPNYIQYFYNWLRANGSQTPTAGKVLYEVLFNVPGFSSSYYSFFPTSLEPGNDQTAAKYRDIWKQ